MLLSLSALLLPHLLIAVEDDTQKIEANGKTVTITIPEVPKVNIKVPTALKVNTVGGSEATGNTRTIKFSKRMPPNYTPHRFDQKEAVKNINKNPGMINHGRVAAYLRGEFLDVKTVEKRLKAAGFDIVASLPVNKKGTLTSVVFTNKALITMVSKPGRGFMASLRVLVDTKAKRISITNPIYMAKGFLQDDYDDEKAKKILTALTQEFRGLKDSKDMLKFQLLPKYQFMNGMPRYENMEVVATGDNLLEKLKNNKRVLFTQTLENGATLVGIKLHKRTNKFTKKIGTNNAAMLPYPLLIEEGKAKILDPKYYIAFMYPLLKMSEFMTIATIPDAIKKDAMRVFR